MTRTAEEENPPVQERRTVLQGLRSWATKGSLASLYGFLAVVAVGVVQTFFSVHKGGYFPEQWYWGLSVVLTALGISVLVPGYFSPAFMGRKQKILAGILILFTALMAASILWSISPELSNREASRTAMYAGAFVLLLPAAARWGSFIIDVMIFGGLLPPALYGLLQKVYPTLALYTGLDSLELDPKASSTLGYHPAFGMMCAMGILLAVSRVGSLRSIPLRALYSSTSVVFLVALYFTFSRGAVLALAGGAVVLLVLSKRRFEMLGNLLIPGLAALWVILQVRDLPGLVMRPVTRQQMQIDGWILVDPLLKALLVAFIAQVAFSIIIRLIENFVPENVGNRAKAVGAVAVAVVVLLGLGQGWTSFRDAGGVEGLRDKVMANNVYSDQSIIEDPTQRYASFDAAARIELWKVGLENWRQHPFTGTGGDTYQVVFEREKAEGAGDVLHPHSMWISWLSDAGVFAFLAFATFSLGLLTLAAYNVFSSTRSRRSRALIAGSAAAATAYLISSSIDWNWYIPASTLPFFALAAVAAGMRPGAATKAKRQTGQGS